MALSDDQKAMLRLLSQGDVSIEDIAALKGKSVEQVRAEVTAALGEAKEPAPEPTPEEPPAPEPVPAEPPAQPQPPAPSPPAKAPEPSRPAKAREAKAPARSPLSGVPAERRRLLVLTGGALALIAVVLGAIALIGGSDSDSPTNEAAPGEITAAEEDKITQAMLEPVDGSDASGRAIFGRLGRDEVVLQVTAENLEPSPSGQSYTVWLYRSPKLSLRVGSVRVGEDGRLGVRLPIPAELLAYVAGGAFDQISVSRTSNAAYKREVERAKESKSLPRYSGETVLRGEIVGPLAEATAGGN